MEKSIELFNAIEQSDRKLARRLLLDEEVELTIVHLRALAAFLKVAVESRDVLLAHKLLELIPVLSPAFGARILWIVAEDGDTEIASMLVRAGADVNVNRPHRPNFLHVLAKRTDPRKLELAVLMLEHGADVMAKSVDGSTPLSWAIEYNNFNFARELLKWNAGIGQSDVKQVVLSDQMAEWIKILVDDYPESLVTRRTRINDFFYCLCQLDADEEKITYAINALLETKVPDVHYLCNAVLREKIALVKTILDSSQVDDATKIMLLHPAVILKDTTMTELLVEWGAHLNHQVEADVAICPTGSRPLHTACEYQSEPNIRLLLRLGADVNVMDDLGTTPLSKMWLKAPKLTVLSRLIIKHLARSVAEGNDLKDKDVQIIHNNPCLLKFYENCLKELQSMKNLKLTNSFAIYSIFTVGIRELSVLSKRRGFIKKRNFIKFVCPLYYNQLNDRIREAEKRRDLLYQTENALFDTLGEILPSFVIEKIMLNLYYSSIYLEVE